MNFEKLKQESINMPPEKIDNPSGIIVFDVETTGLDDSYDEILQVSIIDGDNNTLINTYVKPYYRKEWPEAALINGITKEMVMDAPYPHEIIPKIKGIFESAHTIVAYNGSFDLGFLLDWGIEKLPNQKERDVMKIFAVIYGQWDSRNSDYKWKKLVECAEYYGYSFKAHDSLEDVKATLHCYNCILNQKTWESFDFPFNGELDWPELKEIRLGLEHGLSEEQLNLYATPKYDCYQMIEIREGLMDGLSIQQVKMYATPEYDWFQMFQIRTGLEDGLSEEQIKMYADPNTDWIEMKSIRLNLIKQNEKKI